MAYRNDDLELTFSPARGYWHFVLRMEPPGSPGSEFNASKTIKGSTSSHVDEWLKRLESCEPDALHVSLVNNRDASKLWAPCVFDDPDSPSAIGGDGCVCKQAFCDPVTWL